MKKILSVILTLTLILGLFTIPAFAAEGDSADNPILIGSVEDFESKLASNTGKYFKLTADLVFTGNHKLVDFYGAGFDGNNHSIELQYSGSDAVVGLFRYLRVADGATCVIKDLTINGVINATASSSYAGALAGRTYNSGATYQIENVVNNAEITGGTAAGGFIGNSAGSNKTTTKTIKFNNCTNLKPVTGTNAGGFIGTIGTYAIDFSINNCKNEGAINGATNAGGFVGAVTTTSSYIAKFSVDKCANLGDITKTATTDNAVGGIIGDFVSAHSSSVVNVTNTYNAGDISGQSRMIAGIIGKSAKKVTIDNCFNAGTLKAICKDSIYGAIISYTTPANSVISNCYNVGKMIPFTAAGSAAPICNDLSNGTVTLTNCYYIDDSVINESKINGATKCTPEELANAELPSSDWSASAPTLSDAYPYPQLEGNPYEVSGLDAANVIGVVTNVYADGKAEEGYEINGVTIDTDYACVFAKCKDVPFWTTTFGVKLAESAEDFENGYNAVFAETETLKRPESGSFGVLFYGDGLKAGTYYAQPYAIYTAPDGTEITVTGQTATFTME